MIGLTRGTVRIIDHQPEWEQIAAASIAELITIFNDHAVDIQHIGSTAIRGIKAKPIIDIAAGVRSFSDLSSVLKKLEIAGWQKKHNRFSNDLLYVIENNHVRTHQLHILIHNCIQWHNYVDLRDYMNAFPEKAKEYEELKTRLVHECDNVQTVYTDGKREYMLKTLADAREYASGR